MTKTTNEPTDALHTPQRRDRAIRLRRRITATVAAGGVGTVAAFGLLAASHNSGTAMATATTTATKSTASASSSAASTTPSSSASAATGTPTIAPATAAPTASPAPTAAAVTGGSGG